MFSNVGIRNQRGIGHHGAVRSLEHLRLFAPANGSAKSPRPAVIVAEERTRLAQGGRDQEPAGGKLDPTRIIISDISETTDCALARILRKRLHRLGIRDGFKAVYSPEIVNKSMVRSTEGEQNKASIVGTISYMPAAFGIACASVVIRDLTNNLEVS